MFGWLELTNYSLYSFSFPIKIYFFDWKCMLVFNFQFFLYTYWLSDTVDHLVTIVSKVGFYNIDICLCKYSEKIIKRMNVIFHSLGQFVIIITHQVMTSQTFIYWQIYCELDKCTETNKQIHIQINHNL